MIHTELRVRRSPFSKIKSALFVVFSFALMVGNVSFAVPTIFGQVANAAAILPAPILDVPTNDLTMNGALVTNKWYPVSGAVKYIYNSYHDIGATQLRHAETTTNTQKSAAGIANGTFWWRVKAVDAAGNEGLWSELWKATIDNSNSAPVAVINLSINATTFTVQFNEAVNPIEAANPANYLLNNWPGAGGSGDLVGDATVVYDVAAKKSTVTFTNSAWYISPEQQWGVQNIHDLAGNVLLSNPTLEYSSPMIAPTVPGNIHATTTVNDRNIAWVWDGSTDTDGSGVKGYYYQLTKDGSEVVPFTFTTATSAVTSVATGGNYQLNVYAADNAGNQSGTASGAIAIDAVPPQITLDNIAPAVKGNTTTVTGAIDDTAVTELEAFVDGSSVGTKLVSGGEFTFDIDDLSVGNHNVIVKAVDAVGNEGTSPLKVAVVTATPVTTTGPSVPQNTPVEGDNGRVPETPADDPNAPQVFTRPIVALGGQTSLDDQDVLASEDTKATASTDTSNQEVKGTSDVQKESTSSTFAFAWYWWLAIIAGAIALWMVIAAISRRLRGQN